MKELIAAIEANSYKEGPLDETKIDTKLLHDLIAQYMDEPFIPEFDLRVELNLRHLNPLMTTEDRCKADQVEAKLKYAAYKLEGEFKALICKAMLSTIGDE